MEGCRPSNTRLDVVPTPSAPPLYLYQPQNSAAVFWFEGRACAITDFRPNKDGNQSSCCNNEYYKTQKKLNKHSC